MTASARSLRVLFLCTGNSARSQMAETLLRTEADRLGVPVEAASAGVEPKGVNPLTIKVMRESGVDLAGAESKHLDRFVERPWDYVITVCDQAQESCPIFPGAGEMLHWSFPDPAAASGSDEERLDVFRSVRAAIRERVIGFLRELK